jgi:integrase
MWYVRVWQPENGTYTTAKSCGMIADKLGIDRRQWPPTQKAAAKIIVEQWLASYGSANRKNNPPLGEYCRDFWTWDISQYIKSKTERGQSIGRSHCNNSKYRIETYIMPRTEGVLLRDVTAQFLDQLLLRLRQELPKQSAKSINMIMSALTTPIREAYRLQMLPHNPALNFRGLAQNPKRRGVFTAAEIQALFSSPWDFERYRLIATVGCLTGARMGEILALTTEDIDTDAQGLPFLWIRKSWSFHDGREKSTKTGNVRQIPINETLRKDLLRLARDNPHGTRFIFWGAEPDKPITARMTERAFINQLRRIGIDEASRKSRLLSFHSLRHYFNTVLRSKLPDPLLRLATGHSTEKMTAHYDHPTAEKMAEIRRVIGENIVF